MKIYLLDITKGVDEGICREHFPLRFKRAERFRFEEDRLRSYGAAALIYKALGLCENDIKIGEYGKPYSDKTEWKFSISHSGSYCVLAVGDREIGADIEKISRDYINVGKRVFTSDEIEYVNGNADRFFALWTLKESVSKAVGKGMMIHFNSFDVLPLLKGEPITAEGRILYGKNMAFDGYSLSVCTEGKDEEIEMIY